MKSILSLLKQFFPPDLSPHYIRAELPAILQTIEIAAAGMLLALAFGFVVGLWIGARMPGSRALYAALVVVRSFPDIVLALLCVVLLGVGAAPGVAGIALFYGAAIGKINADLFRATPRGPVEALQATGATRLMVAFYGPLQLRATDLISYGTYEFESALRAAVIVGAVGGGGLGVELIGAINAFEYRRACTLILLLMALIAVLDQAARYVKARPRLLILAVPLMALALWRQIPQMFAWQHAVETFGKMLPPTLPREDWTRLPLAIWQTLEIAFGGTFLALAAAIPLGLCAARNVAPVWVSAPVRRLLELLRSVPEVVWGLILVTAAVLGPPAGIAALALHCAGALGRLFAESFENVPAEPVRAIAATGASRSCTAMFAHLPLAGPTLAVHALFRVEWNVRAATVVGIIGAGGVGQALFNSMQLFFYRQMMFYILITGVLVALVDALSSRSRKALGLSEVHA